MRVCIALLLSLARARSVVRIKNWNDRNTRALVFSARLKTFCGVFFLCLLEIIWWVEVWFDIRRGGWCLFVGKLKVNWRVVCRVNNNYTWFDAAENKFLINKCVIFLKHNSGRVWTEMQNKLGKVDTLSYNYSGILLILKRGVYATVRFITVKNHKDS